ncbi:MAG: hypothetical protein IJ099_07350 [Alphaproteobacteria bacterium]|nr:hypothetical protein [Alphaproteobacteria bacterium]
MVEYIGKRDICFHTEHTRLPWEDVRIEEHIKYDRYVPYLIHEITNALERMSEDEQLKVIEAITCITDNRIKFDIPEKPDDW